jgi:hypothetical protein
MKNILAIGFLILGFGFLYEYHQGNENHRYVYHQGDTEDERIVDNRTGKIYFMRPGVGGVLDPVNSTVTVNKITEVKR